MTVLHELIDVDAIRARARATDPARTVLTLLALPLFALGWAAGVTWTVLAWSWAAVQVGWEAGRRVGQERR